MSILDGQFQLAIDDMKAAGPMALANNARAVLKALGLKTDAEVERIIMAVAEQVAYDTRYGTYSGPEYYAEVYK